MKLGLSTWSLLSLDVYSAVEVIGDSGLEYIELWGEVPHAYPDWVDRNRLRDALSTHDMIVTMHAPFTDLNPASPFQPVKASIEKTLEEFVEFSSSLGAKMVTVHPGSVHNELLLPMAAESAVGTIRKMVRAAGGRLSINVENQTKSASKYHFPLAATAESLRRILDGADGALCTLDTGHAHANGQDLLQLAATVEGRLAEVHLSDNAGSSDEHLVPGRGTARLAELLKRMAGSDALLCLELNPHTYSTDQVMASIPQVRKMLAG